MSNGKGPLYNNPALRRMLGDFDNFEFTNPPTPGRFDFLKNINIDNLRGRLTGFGVTGIDEMGEKTFGQLPGLGALEGLATIGAGIGDIRRAKKDIARGKREKREAIRDQRAFRRRASRGDFDAQVAQAQRDLAAAGLRRTDQSQFAANLATSQGALASDPRALLGGVGSLLGQSNQASLMAQQADVNRELAAKSNLAGLEQTALNQNIGFRKQLGLQDYEDARQAQIQAQQNIEAARQARREGFGNILKGGVQTAMSFAAPGGAFAMEEGGRVYEEGGEMGGKEDVLKMLMMQRGMQGMQGGAPVQKLEGEFNHDTNKKAIIDEETGVKEAEATGGEYILNPEQGESIDEAQEMIAEKIERGKKPTKQELMMLYKAVREVFSQPQFDEE
mgnify:CR=1 FL=1|tara:strand:+ start:1465 stop:2634 length:1170 start_codon:yes stop_codon:yes gene_type:complete